MKNLACLSALLLLGLVPACGGGNGSADTGSSGTDAPAMNDGGERSDVGEGTDTGLPDTDTGTTETDAGTTETDAGLTLDAGVSQDTGCSGPRCAPIPPGCHYEGSTPCECGTLVCPAAACDPTCDRGEYCDLCGESPACAPTPTGTGRICPDVYMPVCGCDGMTYSNGCSAGAAGMSVMHDGECGSTGPSDSMCDPDCGPGESCQACRGPGGAVYVCIPEGAVC